jgi:MFS family permease
MFSTLKKPALLKIYSIPLLVMITDTMTFAISILFALELNADILQINLITTIGMVMGIMLEVPFGMLSDRLGRKPMLIWSRTIVIFGTLINVLATNPNHLIISSLLGGLAGGEFFPILLSMIGDITEVNKRQEAISTMFLFSSFGMLIGPIICSSLLLLPIIKLRTIYQIVLVGQAALVFYIVGMVHETKSKPVKGSQVSTKVYLTDLLRQKNFQMLLAMGFFFSLSRSITGTYIPIFAKKTLFLSDAEVASFSIFGNLAVMVMRFVSASFVARIQSGKTLLTMQFMGGMAGILCIFANNYVSIILILFISGLSYGGNRILESVLVANNSRPQNRGVANSLQNVSVSIGGMAKILTTPIVDFLGFVPTFLVGGIMGFAALLPPLIHKPLIVTLRSPVTTSE